MKKAIVGLVAFALVAMTGSAMAWQIDSDTWVYGGDFDMSYNMDTDNYGIYTDAGLDGTGWVRVHGSGDEEGMSMRTAVPEWYDWFGAEGSFYANQIMWAEGCCPECCPEDGQDCECPDLGYMYVAGQGGSIDGYGAIQLMSNVDQYPYIGNPDHDGTVNAQSLDIVGEGDFTAFQFSTLDLYCDDIEYTPDDYIYDPAHSWNAGGTGLDGFEAWGVQRMFRDDCFDEGWFEIDGYFEGDECPCTPCEPDCPCECPE